MTNASLLLLLSFSKKRSLKFTLCDSPKSGFQQSLKTRESFKIHIAIEEFDPSSE